MKHRPRFEDLPASLKKAICKQDGTFDRIEAAVAERDEKAERVLQSRCEDILRMARIKYIHLKKDVKKYKGYPDLIFSVNGYGLAVELKTETGKLDADQKEMFRLMLKDYFWVVIRSLSDFQKLIDFYQKAPEAAKLLSLYCEKFPERAIHLEKIQNLFIETEKSAAKSNGNAEKPQERVASNTLTRRNAINGVSGGF